MRHAIRLLMILPLLLPACAGNDGGTTNALLPPPEAESPSEEGTAEPLVEAADATEGEPEAEGPRPPTEPLPPAQPEPPPGLTDRERTEWLLAHRVVSAELDGVLLSEACVILARQAGVPIRPQPEIEPDLARVRLRFHNLPLEQALTWICRQVNTNYQVISEVGIVLTHRPVDARFDHPHLQVHYIEDLYAPRQRRVDPQEVFILNETIRDLPQHLGHGSMIESLDRIHERIDRDLEREVRVPERQRIWNESEAIRETAAKALRPLLSDTDCTVAVGPHRRFLLARLPATGHARLEALLAAMREGSAGSAAPTPPPATLGLPPELAETPVHITIEDAYLPEVIAHLSAVLQRNIGYAPGLNPARGMDIAWKGIPIERAVEELARATDRKLRAYTEGEGIWLDFADASHTLGTRRLLWERVTARAYPVGDLPERIPPHLLLEALRREAAVDPWNAHGTVVALFPRTESLIVLHTESVHAEIPGALRAIRRNPEAVLNRNR